MTAEPDGLGNTSSADIDPLGRLADEYAERIRRGEHPLVSEYAGRYPDLAEAIRDLFPALAAMEQLKTGRTALPRHPGRPARKRRSSGWATT